MSVARDWISCEDIVGIFVLSHTETPGLGGNVDLVNSENTWYNVLTGTTKDETGRRPDFQEQFRGVAADETKLKKDGGKIDALSGATITSDAVSMAVRKSLELLKAILSEKDGKAE